MKELSQEILGVLKNANFEVAKCSNRVFESKSFKINISLYFLLIILACDIGLLIFHFYHGIRPIQMYINMKFTQTIGTNLMLRPSTALNSAIIISNLQNDKNQFSSSYRKACKNNLSNNQNNSSIARVSFARSIHHLQLNQEKENTFNSTIVKLQNPMI